MITELPVDNLVEDVELSFRLFEFSIRTMCYAELKKFDSELFGQQIQLNLPEENVFFSNREFQNTSEIIKASQMAVGAAFGATAICLDCLLKKYISGGIEILTIKSLVAAVRNAFSHGIAAPSWYVKSHKYEKLSLLFVGGPEVDLAKLNGKSFEYSQIGGLALWFRVKDYVLAESFRLK
jgi:hypothetical protein